MLKVNVIPFTAMCNSLRPDDHVLRGVERAIREGKRVGAGGDSYHVPSSHNAIPALRKRYSPSYCSTPLTSILVDCINILLVLARFLMMRL